MLLKRLAEVRLSDITALCDNAVLESRFIDFKAEAIGGGDKDKREFLADVSAFANASGGDIVLGMRTKDGAAHEVCGIVLDDPDKEKLRLGDIVRFGLEPRPSGVDVIWLPIEAKCGVMVIRVPRSWTAPHRVTFLRDMNFYARNAAGRHPMNVDELRFAFNSSREFVQRLRDFRGQRIQRFSSRTSLSPCAAGRSLCCISCRSRQLSIRPTFSSRLERKGSFRRCATTHIPGSTRLKVT